MHVPFSPFTNGNSIFFFRVLGDRTQQCIGYVMCVCVQCALEALVACYMRGSMLDSHSGHNSIQCKRFPPNHPNQYPFHFDLILQNSSKTFGSHPFDAHFEVSRVNDTAFGCTSSKSKRTPFTANRELQWPKR